jgi:hypothetical protein
LWESVGRDRIEPNEVECVLLVEPREAEMKSLKRLINQFREEIARYEVRQPIRN